MSGQGELVVESGEAALQWTLQAGLQVLGRDPGADLCLPWPMISRRQMQLTCDDRGCWIENLSQTNPTYLNGQRLAAPTRLADGDLLGIGHVRLRFRVPPSPGVEPYGRLLIRQAGRPDHDVMLTLAEVTVGRDPACTVPLDYPAISWRHLRLEWQAHAHSYQLVDLQSDHGVLVDERRLDRPLLLRPHSQIWLGDALGNGVSLIYLPADETISPERTKA